MITVRDVESTLYNWAPSGLAASWDNVGLLVGAPDREVKKILTTLDITESVVDEAVQTGADPAYGQPPGPHPHGTGGKPYFRHLYAHESGCSRRRCQRCFGGKAWPFADRIPDR